MQKLFRHLRSQPKSVRDRYAFVLAASFTFMVLGVWLVAKSNPGSAGVIATEKPLPFATFIKKTREHFANLTEGFKTEGGAEKTQTAALGGSVGNSASSSAATLILTQDTVEMVNAASASSTETKSEGVIYQEVLIGTTSASFKGNSSSSQEVSPTRP